MGCNTRVLVAYGKGESRSCLLESLALNGYECQTACSKEEVLDRISAFRPDIVVLDLSNAGNEGMEVLDRLRGWSHAVVLALLEECQDGPVISVLDGGAHECVSKSVPAEVILAHVRALERCREAMLNQEVPSVTYFVSGDLCIDYAAETVSLAGKEIHLTPHEYQLLRLLSLNAGNVLSHQRILREVWGGAQEGDLASLRVLVGTLRKKIEEDPSNPCYIQTKAGVGYRMVWV